MSAKKIHKGENEDAEFVIFKITESKND